MAVYYRYSQWEHLSKLVWAGFILGGIFFLVVAMVHYQLYRNNPKVVSLTTVITYLFLGVLTISIPFLNKLLSE